MSTNPNVKVEDRSGFRSVSFVGNIVDVLRSAAGWIEATRSHYWDLTVNAIGDGEVDLTIYYYEPES